MIALLIQSLLSGGVSYTTSTFSSTLTMNSTMFTRHNGNAWGLYYCEVIELNFSTNGFYSIESNSSIDLYGFIYNNSFDSLSPSTNRLTWDNDNAGNRQFQILLNVNGANNYILVVTTFAINVVGPFSIIIRGLADVGFSPSIQPGMSETNPWSFFLATMWYSLVLKVYSLMQRNQ